MRVFKAPAEFEWDQGNIGKNKKHKVEDKESEEAFLDENKRSRVSLIILLTGENLSKINFE